MKEFRKILSLLLILALIIPGMAFANEPEENINNPETEYLDLTHDERVELDKIKELINSFDSADRKKIDIDNTEYDNKPVRIIVELKDKPVISYATQYGVSYSTMAESQITAIEDNILNVQDSIKRDISNRRIDFKIDKSFTTVFNGFSGEAEYKDIERIENVPGVKKVYISQEYERPDIKPEMNSSNEMVRSLSTWKLGYKGEGMVVAVIDTGIDPSHKDMVLSDGTTPSLTEQIVLDTGLEGKYYTEKVPYGYNYYDLNHEILDLGPGASEHGMHVAGTVGANGDPENGGIKGVAPEAQLLAMKVFSNDPLYATTFDDIYLAAMEDAIKLNANVLNMSLGSTASFYDSEGAVNVAITNAVENGIVCAISAGNSAMFGNMYDLPWKENPDIGVVGAPGLSYDSIQVASIENDSLFLPYMEVYIGEEESVNIAYHNPSPVDPIKFFNGEKKEVVYVGTGEPQFYEGKDVEGKIVLAVRTGGFFYSKIQHEAEEHGAAGVIVRGTEGHGDYVNMALDNPSIPVISLSIGDGNMLAEKAVENEISVIFKEGKISVPNGAAGKMSDFTSWGTTPSLELKPEITAPGGQIYSTLQNNNYGTMSGTSMASPHVAGGAALVSQYIKTNDNLTKVPLNELLTQNDEEIKFSVLPNSTVIIENSAFSVEILEGNEEKTVNAQKCIVDARKNNKDVYVKLYTGRIAELSGKVVSDYSVISKTITYVDASGNEIIYELESENSIEEQTKLAKILLMNTSEIVYVNNPMYGKQPVSPRCQGSGLMDLNSAVTTPCFVVNRANNEAKVELKDFKDTTFTLELRAVNVTDEEVTYNIDVDVLTDYIYKFDGDEKDYNVLLTRPMTANVAIPEPITVPAHGAKDFSIEIDFSEDEGIYENMFVEGFVKLIPSEEATYEGLSIPYVGFYGKWDEPAILDGIPELGEESFYGYSGMVDTDGYFMDVFAISPGTDFGMMFGTDTLTPVLSFLRNAEKVQCNILDAEGKQLRTISNEEFVRKNYYDGGRDLPYSYNPNRAWDGRVKGEIVEDGQYVYEVKTKIHYEDAKWQTKQIPIIVDKTPPVLNNVEFDEESKELSFKANDALTGIAGALVFVNGNEVNMKELKEDVENKGSYSIGLAEDVKDLESIRIEVDVFDFVYNIAYEVLEIGEDVERPELYLETPDLLEVYTDSQIVFTGAVFGTNLDPIVTIDDVEAVVWFDPNIEIFEPGSDEVLRSGPGYRYQAVLEFEDGVQEVSVKVTTNGGIETSTVRRFYVDTTPPELSYEVKKVNEETGKATLTVTMKDNFPVLKLYAFDSEVFSYDGLQEEYLNIEPVEKIVDIEVDLEEGTNVIPLTLVDIGGNTSKLEVTIEREEAVKSSDATLEILKYGDIEIQLEDDKFDYVVELSAGTTEVSIVSAVASDANANVQVTQATGLEEGSNVATVVVTAEDGITAITYTITFTVAVEAEV